MKILSYRLTRLPTNQYEGKIDIDTEGGKHYTACFHASNFCIHDGRFFNVNSVPFSSESELRELHFSLSQNGMTVTPAELGELEAAMKEVIIEKA